MKRLKFACPFGGKKYPMYIMLAGLIFIPAAAEWLLDPEFSSLLAILLLGELIIAFICWFIEHHLSPEERETCSSMLPPLWEPVSEAVLNELGEQSGHVSREAGSAIGIGAVLAVSNLLPTRRHPEINPRAAFIFGVIAAAVFAADLFRRMLWKNADSSAVCTEIPIDHMYEVTHHSRRRTWTESYLVFYQPEGKYILKAKPGCGDVGKIVVVKYHGMVTWVAAPKPIQSRNGFYF